MQLITLQNQLAISYLTLAQLLELPSAEGFAIQVPDHCPKPGQLTRGTPTQYSGWQRRSGRRFSVPSISSRSAEYDLAIAKGAEARSYRLAHRSAPAYSDNRIDINTLEPYDFWTQMDDQQERLCRLLA
ncbi:MAG: hypothetical protein MZV63_40545 [Marinilabiliales bacterium]|nr:hypothetical protein [Marinilabiliales bacterium]